MNQLIKLILNTTTFLLVLIINYLSNTDLIGKLSVGNVSNMYPTVITPAGYAFSIWGLIYLLLTLFVGYQWYLYTKRRGKNLIDSVGYYFTLSNLANAFWVIAWVNNQIALSLILIILLLVSLFKLVQKLNLERWDAPFSVILFVWWPITIYFGWIILATVLNIKVFFVSVYGDALWGAAIWGSVLIVLSTFIYIYLIYGRNMREAAIVGIWGFIAIAYRQNELNPAIAIFAVSGAVVLLINVFYHAYKRRLIRKIRG